mmetsp:Transcript_40514/g.103758  ORF Transcript_40514/g.103758 Transcript_40514/m.103758 type:complete len:200 (-) Transcript_40514:254-853(-)
MPPERAAVCLGVEQVPSNLLAASSPQGQRRRGGAHRDDRRCQLVVVHVTHHRGLVQRLTLRALGHRRALLREHGVLVRGFHRDAPQAGVCKPAVLRLALILHLLRDGAHLPQGLVKQPAIWHTAGARGDFAHAFAGRRRQSHCRFPSLRPVVAPGRPAAGAIGLVPRVHQVGFVVIVVQRRIFNAPGGGPLPEHRGKRW